MQTSHGPNTNERQINGQYKHNICLLLWCMNICLLSSSSSNSTNRNNNNNNNQPHQKILTKLLLNFALYHSLSLFLFAHIYLFLFLVPSSLFVLYIQINVWICLLKWLVYIYLYIYPYYCIHLRQRARLNCHSFIRLIALFDSRFNKCKLVDQRKLIFAGFYDLKAPFSSMCIAKYIDKYMQKLRQTKETDTNMCEYEKMKKREFLIISHSLCICARVCVCTVFMHWFYWPWWLVFVTLIIFSVKRKKKCQ